MEEISNFHPDMYITLCWLIFSLLTPINPHTIPIPIVRLHAHIFTGHDDLSTIEPCYNIVLIRSRHDFFLTTECFGLFFSR